MGIYISENRNIARMFIDADGKREVIRAWVNRGGVPAKVFDSSGFKPVSWQDGTDEQITAMLDMHYAGKINIYNYWKVGDTRTVTLSAMASVAGETQPEQTVTMTLMNQRGKTLVNPINGHTECAFIVGQKCVLKNTGKLSTNSSVYVWNSCARRTWCNGVYRDSFPETIRSIFKQHINRSASNVTTGAIDSKDYFSLPSEKEVLGTSSLANATVQAQDVHFEYYKTSANRKKYPINVTSGSYPYLLRSVRSKSSSTPMTLYITANGTVAYEVPTTARYIATFGVI